MVRSVTSMRRRAHTWWGALEVGALALLAYVPFFVSAPGQVSADTKQYLYLDPGRFLWRALHLWDPQVAAGTVSHQHIGYLFPMGPWFWAFEQLGAPDWVAQRLWLGTISLAAALGARWLFALLGVSRAGALAGALVYMLTPYQLAFTARISALLLPWAALPWLVGLAMRSVRRGGWRDAALFALVILTVSGVNASTLVFVGLGPLLWLLVEASRSRQAARAVLGAAGRISLLSLAISTWWIVGLRLQGTYGLPVLQLTENLQVISARSSPADLLRGLGNWFFYGRDRLGYSIDQAASYVEDSTVVFFSFAIPVLALLAAAVLRWRHRASFALLVVVGTVVGVGAWPYEEPSAYGDLWRSFAETSSIGLALRNTARVAPVIVLGLAGLLAGALGAITRQRLRVAAAVAVAAVALTAFAPVWETGYLSDGVRRPEEVPAYWREAAAAIDAGGRETRVLEVPGVNFSAYRWGNTVEPVTPGLTDRPYLAREVLPYGSPATVNLLDALDRRLQQGTFEPASLAPVARLFAAGTVSLRSDLQFERFGTPRPRPLWDLLTEPLPPGLDEPESFGPAEPNTPPAHLAALDELDLLTPASVPDPPPVALFDVEGTQPIVHAAPTSNPVVLAGDADGIVEAASAGLVDGGALLFELGAMGEEELRDALAARADLVLTDSNRRRAQRFFASLRETLGETERVGTTAPDPVGDDSRLEPFPDPTDDTRTVVEQEGGQVESTALSVPQDRAARAFDGDPRTAWRVGGADPSGERLSLELEEPVAASSVTLVQPQDGPRDRVLSEVDLRFDGGEPMRVQLGPESLDQEGQVVPFPARELTRLEIELVATSVPPMEPERANVVGFAEVALADVRVTETVRLPVDLAGRVGADAAGSGLDVVLARLRSDPGERGAPDQELSLRRRFELPDDRSFRLTGTARLNPSAPDTVLDEVLGTVAPGATFSSSGHLAGDPAARASRALDGDTATWWTAPRGRQEDVWLQVDLAAPVEVDNLDLTVVADGRHSVPTSIRLEADGEPVATVPVPEIADGGEEGTTRQVSLPFPPVQARQLRLVVDGVRRTSVDVADPGPEPTLPVALAEVVLGGVPRPADPAGVPSTCSADLLQVDGEEVAVRLTGSPADGRSGLAIETCDGDLELDAGSHRVDASPGLDTGIDLDRLVLSSGPDGSAAVPGVRGARTDEVGSTVRVVDAGPTSFDLSVQTDGKPFWLILGQSNSAGWQADSSSGSMGARQLVNGYANGWLVDPSAPGPMTVELRWTPQRLVWVGLAVSVAALAACLAILVSGFRGRRIRAAPAADLSHPAHLASPFSSLTGPVPWRATAALVVITSLTVAAISRPWIGAIAGLASLAAARIPVLRGIVTLAVPVLVVLSHLLDAPHLAWVAVALLLADLVVAWLRRRSGQAAEGGVAPARS